MFLKSNKKETKIETIIGSNTDFEGNIRTQQGLRIEGKIKGEIWADAVVLGEAGVILGDITARKVTVAGKVKGNISASESLELYTKGQILGDIKTSKLLVADGACFEGNCQMIKQEGQIIEINPQSGEPESHHNGNHKSLKVVAANGKQH
jgi:cytoskeletal protein CcmA (bactofilin family)